MSRFFYIEFKEFDKENIEKIINWLDFHSESEFPYFVNYETKQMEFVYGNRSFWITMELKPSMFLKYDKKLNRVHVRKKDYHLSWIWNEDDYLNRLRKKRDI